MCQDFFLRAPAFSLETLYNLNTNIANNPEKFSEIVLHSISDEYFSKALYFASPDFWNLVQKVKSKPQSYDATRKIAISIYKYIIRSCTRSVPFGMFSGITVGSTNIEKTAIELLERTLHSTTVRYDYDYLQLIKTRLTVDKELKSKLRYYPNNTIYRFNNSLRFIDMSTKGDDTEYKISSINYEPLIEEIINLTTNEGITHDEFIELTGNSLEGVELFNDLIDSRVLVNELEPNLTGESYFNRIVRRIRECDNEHLLYQELNLAKHILEDLNSDSLYRVDLGDHFLKLFPTIKYSHKFQADLLLGTSKCNIKKEVIDKLSYNIQDIISYFVIDRYSFELEEIKNFIRQKYEASEVPLLLLFDPDIGFNEKDQLFDMPLIDNLEQAENSDEKRSNKLERLQNSILENSILNDFSEVELTANFLEKTLKLSHGAKRPIKDQFYVLGSLYASDPKEIDENKYRFEIVAIDTGNASRLSSRFGHLSSAIAQTVKRMGGSISDENDTITAEIIYVSHKKTGNIATRDILTEYEIPYLAISTLPIEKQIPLSDILVSLQGNKIKLRSKKLKKFIVPRLSSAHNYSLGHPIYKFLCDVSRQDLYGFNGISKGINLPYFPRVTYKNIILSKAVWRISIENLHTLSIECLAMHLGKLEKLKKLPRFVTIVEGDNELMLDRTLNLSLDLMLDSLKKYKNLVLKEFILQGDKNFVKGEDGTFMNEILFQVGGEKPTSETQILRQSSENLSDNIQKNFLPGDRWIYFKIYSGSMMIDNLIANVICPLMQQMEEQNFSEQWFFIRYYDPSPHLRLRIYTSDISSITELTKQINNALRPYINNGLVHSVCIDTYKREIERYGAKYIENSESVFHADSIVISKIIKYVKSQINTEDYRVVGALILVKKYLDDFITDNTQKYEFVKSRKKYFFEEFKGDKNLITILKQKYRYFSNYLNCLDPHQLKSTTPEIEYLINVVNSRNKIINDLNLYYKCGHLISDYIHMAINRTFIKNQRLHELFIYDILEQHYKSATKKLSFANGIS